jgi:hypothetical protein
MYVSILTDRKYNSIWRKYRPALLRLMVDASKGPQRYQFVANDFAGLDHRSKKDYCFSLSMNKSKSVNSIRSSPIAIELLHTLQDSKTANQLSQFNTYEFVMDKHYVLHVSIAVEQTASAIEEPQAEVAEMS